jgi:hypothetical protein
MPRETWILKNMNKKFLMLLPLSFLIGYSAFGQEKESKSNAKETSDSTIVLGKGRIVYQNRIYHENASYMTMAYGAGYGFESKGIEQNMTLSFQKFFKQVGVQIGYHSSSDSKIWWRSDQKLNDLFVGLGKRLESTTYNFSAFAGPAYSYGSYLYPITDTSGVVKVYPYRFKTVGVHAEFQATYKISYDIGVGLSVYGSVNRYYSAAGAQIHLYFSTAFVRNY